MRKFLCSIKKELKRLLTDKRIVLTSIILPGLILYAMYSIMGEAISSIDNDNDYSIRICGNCIALEKLLDKYNVKKVDKSLETKIKNKIMSEEIDLLIVFPDNADIMFNNANTVDKIQSKKDIPNIKMFYASSNVKSQNAYYEINEIFNLFESQNYNIFDINKKTDKDKAFDLSTEEESSASMLATILPMILLVMMFSGCMTVASESIAGEKERGTLSTILVTSIDRRIYAISKVVSLSIVGLLTAISTTTAIILSMPSLMQMQDLDVEKVYGIKEYMELGAVSISTVVLIVSIISIVSAIAKNAKQASTYMMPLMVVTLAISMGSMLVKSKIILLSNSVI